MWHGWRRHVECRVKGRYHPAIPCGDYLATRSVSEHPAAALVQTSTHLTSMGEGCDDVCGIAQERCCHRCWNLPDGGNRDRSPGMALVFICGVVVLFTVL